MAKKITPKTNSIDLKMRVLIVKKKATKRSPLAVFFNSYPEYDTPENEQLVRAVWNLNRADAEITEKMEKIFLNHQLSKPKK
ncbi:MAG: hypothetical protein UT21_C0006G0038 [Candidatus Woesebacteria bacterium GW2011_GWA1_39_11b]|nr:MAG: hypothetical protein UT21_C0006G0038 [Candidatus Woesebacteria bacterium GW2011_GWA1_39_11b]KKS77116.1 MAG: hypothetical protein UV51_C0010G0021 [Candidatus Woesebacteria bacterium GW2011_GWC1_42_9]